MPCPPNWEERGRKTDSRSWQRVGVQPAKTPVHNYDTLRTVPGIKEKCVNFSFSLPPSILYFLFATISHICLPVSASFCLFPGSNLRLPPRPPGDLAPVHSSVLPCLPSQTLLVPETSQTPGRRPGVADEVGEGSCPLTAMFLKV